jgi:MFS transporter, DHA1 family, tetracycline resistance protein
MAETNTGQPADDHKIASALSGASGLAFVTFSIFSLSFGAGLALPATPALIQSVSDASIEEAAVIGGWMIAIFAACQLVASPLLGRWSDHWGRRPVLLISVGASCVDYLAMCFSPNLLWLFIGRAVAGLFCGIFAVSYAAAADVSKKQTLATTFGVLGAAEGVGYLAGPVIGGMLAGYGERIPFFAAAACLFLTLLYGLFYFRETLVSRQRFPRGFQLDALRAMFLTFTVHKSTMLVLSAIFLLLLSRQVMPSIWPYYAAIQLNWDPALIGMAVGLYAIVFTFAQIWLVRWLLEWRSEFGAANFGLLAAALAGFGIAFFPSPTLVFMWLVVAALSGVALPAIRAIARA